MKEKLSIGVLHTPYGPYEKYFKRVLDLVGGILLLVLFWWVYIIIAILVKINLGSPVIFTQERPGKGEQIFKLYKFRTMTDAKDKNGNQLSDEERLTKFGKWLRSTSLDELPEAFNLINGTLSICGPRPLLVKYLPYYTEKERLRHSVRPGLTGLAQINGRNNLEWNQRLELDVKYVEKVTLLNDLWIIVITIMNVIKKKDIVSGAQMKMRDLDEERRNSDFRIK